MPPETALAAMGFTNLESRLYFELVCQSPLTGYRLSRIVGKAPANTYQALKSLAQKGAVIVSDEIGEATAYYCVPPAELLASLEQAFETKRNAALDALNGLHKPAPEEHIYQLQTVAQVFDRARNMFETAKEIVLFDFFPGIYEMFEDNILAARERGVTVAGITYDRAHASLTTPYNGEVVSVLADLWPGLGLIVVADGAQELIAQISKDKQSLLNGVWSDSVFLSCTYHSALAAEIRLTAMRLDPSDPLKILSLMRARPPGLRTILGTGQVEGSAGSNMRVN